MCADYTIPRNPEIVAAEQAWHAAQEAAWDAEERFYDLMDASRTAALQAADRIGDR